jgi:hypothetical protein
MVDAMAELAGGGRLRRFETADGEVPSALRHDVQDRLQPAALAAHQSLGERLLGPFQVRQAPPHVIGADAIDEELHPSESEPLVAEAGTPTDPRDIPQCDRVRHDGIHAKPHGKTALFLQLLERQEFVRGGVLYRGDRREPLR